MHMITRGTEPDPRPDPSDAKAYGAYMANAAGCVECHTETVKGEKVGSPWRAASRSTCPMVRSCAHRTSRCTKVAWVAGRREMFIQRFKQYADSSYVAPRWTGKGEFQTIMPWSMYAGMTRQDLGAIYD